MNVFRDAVSWPSLGVISVIQAGAFWGAIMLPFVYLPVLFVGLEDNLARQLLFASLLALNVILLIVGHSHRTN